MGFWGLWAGFSLDSGKALTKKGQLTVVAGAPRANHSGAVVFLKIEQDTSMMSPEYILEGEGLASSFGYDLAVLDLNADGYVCPKPSEAQKCRIVGEISK